VRPHPEHLNGLGVVEDLVDQAVLNADAPRIGAPTKPTRDASADELVRHAQYLEWRAGLLTGKAAALRSIAATR